MPTFRDDPKLGGMVPMMKTDDINDQAITKDKIRDGNVTTEKLADGAVSTDKLPDGAIKTSKIADENITTEKLAEGAVETSKIADQNVTSEKIADQSIDNSKLSPEAVTYDKIKDRAIITEKLNDRAVTTEKVEEKAITNPKLGNQSVDGRVVREASLETKHFANGSVTTEKIKDGSITNEKVADDTLGIEKFDPELRKTIQAATGLPEDLNQMIQDVDKSVKQLKEKDTDLQSQINDKQQQITANDGDISLLQTRSTQMEEAIKGISASGGASQASAVTYENTESGLDSITAQGAIDELANKKFNKENISQEFGDSEDKVVSQFALPFREVESPEFIKVIVDAENHFLFGIQLDGSIEWGRGIPAPIRAKLQEIINQCQQDKTDILKAINAAKEELSASITALQESKVDKEEGKSLIDDEVKECFRVIENEEFIKAIVDSDDKVLFGFYRATGKPYYPLNEMYHVIQNKEYFAAWLDADDKVVLGIRRDGEIIGEIHAVNALKQVISQLQSDLVSLQKKIGTIDTNLKEFLDVFSLQENPEYMAVEKDADGKVLSATYNDGSHYIHNAKSETILEEFSHIEDQEKRMEIVTDADGKVMSFRDSQGKKHEHSMEATNLDVSNLNLQGNSVNNIKDALKANGFDVKTPIDWSENSEIRITEPRLAFINITNIDSMPTNKTQNKHGIFEFWDMQGNYFKKNVILNAQGNSSLGMPKKNFACDFCNDDWIGDDTFKIKFGSWVSQDSFHFKAFYADFFKGVSMIGYKLFNEIESTRSSNTNRIWKRALLPPTDTIGYGTKGMEGTTDVNILIDNGARCYPDGFPCIVHLNGSFYGVFSWALKKHRDNYMQNKSKPENIQLDGDIYDTFMYNGTIDWDVVNGTKASSGGGKDGFEFRNPKSLICFDGTKYDADTNRKELIDSSSESYDSGNKKHILTNKVKAYYSTLTTYIPTLKKMEEQGEEASVIKAKIQSFFDVDSLMDYLIFSDIVANVDGFRKNWQWVTYNGVKWAVAPYDLDGIVGWSGWGEVSPTSNRYGTSLDLPTGWVIKYFDTELCERYKTLRTDVLTVKNIFGLVKDWCSRIGASNFEKDLSKWPQTPEIYSPFKEKHIDNIYRVENWLITRLKKCDEIYKFN